MISAASACAGRTLDTRPRPYLKAVSLRTSIVALLGALAFSTQVLGNEETCVEGSGATAIRACQAALSAGSKRRSVYLALGRRLERLGKYADAVGVYRRGLRAHTGDATLQSRLKLAQSNLDEQKFLTKRGGSSSGAAPSAEAKARFKVNRIRCKTLSGSQALAACESALSVKPGDAGLRRRHAELAGSASGGPPVADALTERQRAQNAEEAARQAAERERNKALIANIQDRLTRLGFDPGPVDGLPGSRTRNAVVAFASIPGVEPPSRELDQALSDALDSALRADEGAQALMSDAEASIEGGDLPAAQDAMSKAVEMAPWSDSLRVSSQRLKERIAEMDESRRRIAAASDLADGARDALASGDLSASLALIEEAMELTPEDTDLDALRRKVEAERTQEMQREVAEREAERRRGEADRLFAAATAAIGEGDLEDAEALVRAGTALAPDDGRFEAQRRMVQAGLDQRERDKIRAVQRRKEIGRLTDLANEAAGRGDLEEGLRILGTGLETYPEAASLLTLQERLTSDRDRLEQEREEVERRSADAERHFALAQAARDRQELDNALSLVQSGLERVPDHPELLALRDDLEVALTEREQERARAQAEREREAAELRARQERETAKAAEQRAAVQRLSAQAKDAAGGGDLELALDLMDQALVIAPQDASLARLHQTLRAARLRESAIAGYREAQRMAEAGIPPSERLAALEKALEQMGQARDLNPSDPSIERLSSRIEDARRFAVEDAEKREQLRQQRAGAESVLRARSRQLVKVEAEIAARELRAKLEAQQVLERSWGDRGTAPD